MLNLFLLFNRLMPVPMNTFNMETKIVHKIPGNFYFFHVTEHASYLEIHLLYTIPKLYIFNRENPPKDLIYVDKYVNISRNGSV